jgi:hypothetical protein
MFEDEALCDVVWFCSRCGHEVTVPASLREFGPPRVKTSPRCAVCSGAACGVVICPDCATLFFHHWGDPSACPECVDDPV